LSISQWKFYGLTGDGLMKLNTDHICNRFFRLRLLCLSLFLVLIAANAQGQAEICGDGIDNDGNGKIDSFDPACASFYGLKFIVEGCKRYASKY
jgi:hypothetical protein